MTRHWTASLLIASFLFASPALFAQRSLHLAIGDPARRGTEAKVLLDAVTDTHTGELITPLQAAERLAGARLIFLGESHTSIDFHRVQLRMIEELERAGRKVLIGLEMYPHTEQRFLDDWYEGLLTPSGFVRLSDWYGNWGYHWNYYRDIFLFARDHGIRMFALNAPREVVAAVSRKGLENLTPEQRSQIPDRIDTSSEEYLTLFKSFFEDEGGMHSMMSDARAKAMLAAQCTWDATMGYNAVQALEKYGDEKSVMVVLIGSGHVAYGLGIQRQANQWYDGPMASLIPIPVIDEEERRVESVRASYADFLWGLPPETDPLYPELGVASVEPPHGPGRKVLSVPDDSPAAAAGVRQGDLLVAMDGTVLTEKGTLNRLMSAKRWGDSAELLVRRTAQDGKTEELTLRVYFRRTAPAPDKPPQKR